MGPDKRNLRPDRLSVQAPPEYETCVAHTVANICKKINHAIISVKNFIFVLWTEESS